MIHNSLARQCLTPIWGAPLKTADGNFREVFQAFLDEENVPANMRVVAFLSRPAQNGIFERNVINSAECDLKVSSVSSLRADGMERPTVVNGALVIRRRLSKCMSSRRLARGCRCPRIRYICGQRHCR